MKTLALALSMVMLLSGCATTYYVGHGQEQSFKSMQECHLAYPDDPKHCVDRAQYTQATQNTWALALQGIGTALLAALTIFVLVGGGK